MLQDCLPLLHPKAKPHACLKLWVKKYIWYHPLKVTLYNAKAISGKFAIKACCLCDILGKALGFLGQKLRDVQSRQTAQAVSCL